MIILFKEIDSFTKGDGKPFNAGENIYRGIDFNTINVNLYSILKKIKQNIHILKVFFYDEEKQDLLIPIPKDLSLLNKNFVKAKLKLAENKGHNKQTEHILFFKEKGKLREKEGFIYLRDLEYYIFDEENISLKEDHLINIIKDSIKAGIKLNRETRNVETGNLYFQKFINFEEDISLLCEINDINLVRHIFTIGAEGKTFKLRKIDINVENIFENDNIDFYEIKSQIQKTKYFKIILLTPTNYPPDIDGAKRIAQLTDKPITFSGWFNVYDGDKKIGSFPSRLFKLISAGSVFYYKINDENKLDEIFEKYWLKPSFFVPEYPYFEKIEDGTNPLGFGISIIGVAHLEE